MNWKDIYEQKATTATEAIKSIKDNDYVVVAETAGVPQFVLKELARHKDDYNNVRISHMLTLGDGDYMKPECYGHFRHIALFVGANSRQALVDNQGDYIPSYFKDVPSLLGTAFPVDVAIVQTSRPDDEGYCHLSLSCDYAMAAVEKAKTVIIEVNDRMPMVGGNNKVHVSKATHIVPCSYELPEVPPAKITDVEKAIGKNCASLINDGDTLQLGIGSIPDAVLVFLKDKKDLGIHSEMISDGVVELIESGVINGAKKTLHPGKVIVTFLMGTRKLYDFIDNNPVIELHPVDYVNDPYVIAQNDNMVSINSCIEVDLQGQVNSESIGLKQFSGTGGQVDYVRGAAMSKGGRAIMAIPSTASHGKVSRIVPFLSQGATVTTSRNDVDYVVTEYGIAKLKGKTLRERAQNLIKIAHPDFREQLQEEYNKRFGL